jgi:hypothetical protein
LSECESEQGFLEACSFSANTDCPETSVAIEIYSEGILKVYEMSHSTFNTIIQDIKKASKIKY